MMLISAMDIGCATSAWGTNPGRRECFCPSPLIVSEVGLLCITFFLQTALSSSAHLMAPQNSRLHVQAPHFVLCFLNPLSPVCAVYILLALWLSVRC